MKIAFEVDGGTIMADAEIGESIMQVAVRSNVPRVIGECGGEMSCATCHVYAADLPSTLPPPSADELDMLEMSDDREDTSRLGCQIRLDASCDGLQVVVPPR